ncbi:hypothetical protein CIPAW_02G090400 [Carya illinoinensis]|uniref:Uncharacterized protein n=1 Tax=Carya illinoinensis TaxID=32201 RepID=A0A8T1RCR1_CARIL|nr:hypothetical protein CIPAW_02G090400 [Carya illinoinensis]
MGRCQTLETSSPESGKFKTKYVRHCYMGVWQTNPAAPLLHKKVILTCTKRFYKGDRRPRVEQRAYLGNAGRLECLAGNCLRGERERERERGAKWPLGWGKPLQ